MGPSRKTLRGARLPRHRASNVALCQRSCIHRQKVKRLIWKCFHFWRLPSVTSLPMGSKSWGCVWGGAFQLSAGSALTCPDLGSLVSPVSDPQTSCQVLSSSLHCSGKQDLYSDGKTLGLVYSPCRHDELMGIRDFVLIGKFSVFHPHTSLTQFVLMVSHDIYSLTIP